MDYHTKLDIYIRIYVCMSVFMCLYVHVLYINMYYIYIIYVYICVYKYVVCVYMCL